MRCRVLEFAAPGRVELAEVGLPPLHDGDVLVRTLYSGISGGTELLAYRGEVDPSLPLDDSLGALKGTFSFPFRYGYSCVGRVEKSLGSLAVGSLVFAFHPHQEALVRPGPELIPVDDLEPRLATMFPLVEASLQIALDAGPLQGQPVVVFGLGAVGLITSALLERFGARVLGVEPQPGRRAVAGSLGIQATTPEDIGDAVAELTSGRGVPVAIEASGNPSALGGALGLLAHEGTALVASWYGLRPVSLDLGGRFHRRRLGIRSTQVSTIPAELSARWDRERRRREVHRLLGELPLQALATHEFPFEDAQRAFTALDKGEEGLLHVALRYEE
jgi:2-desacetyl-2-hydroxyethyl bacteriochlorophyllide A dehydrogenase